MAFLIEHSTSELGPAIRLVHPDGRCDATIHPGLGFNCTNWTRLNPEGQRDELLASSPDWRARPTRGGHPILFPFPNRLRNGQFSHEGKTYTLPKNDATNRHATHGFTPRVAWDVVKEMATEESASVTGRFELAKHATTLLDCWPANATLEVTYTLTAEALQVLATVTNPSLTHSMPFGLGYHPYFRPPGLSASLTIDHAMLRFHPKTQWLAKENIPEGPQIIPHADHVFAEKRNIGHTAFDDGFAQWETLTDTRADGLLTLAEVSAEGSAECLSILVGQDFQDTVIFIPPDRMSIAIEPYTCATDAANLEASGIPSGWKILPPKETWTGLVEYIVRQDL